MAKCKECEYWMYCYIWRDSVADAKFCAVPGCGVRLGMGPSNDEPAEVQVEMRAAEICGHGFGDFTAQELAGWARRADGFDLEKGQEPGWLCSEMAQTRFSARDHDADAWPWDVTRTIAEQQDEIRLYCDADAGLAHALSEVERTGRGFPPAEHIDSEPDAVPTDSVTITLEESQAWDEILNGPPRPAADGGGE